MKKLILLIYVLLLTSSPALADTNFTEVTEYGVENDSINVTTSAVRNNKTEYRTLIQKLGIEEEPFDHVKTVKGKEISFSRTLSSSQNNLLNIIEDSRFVDYIKNNDEAVPVIIVLRQQDLSDITAKMRKNKSDMIDQRVVKIELVHSEAEKRTKPLAMSRIQNVEKIEKLEFTDKETESLRELSSEINNIIDTMRKEIILKHRKDVSSNQKKVKEAVVQCDGILTGNSSIINSVFARINLSCLKGLAKDENIAAVYEDEKTFIKLNDATCAIGASAWYDQGYDGGVWDVAVIDSGIDDSHPALDVDLAEVFHDSGRFDPDYDDDYTTTDDLNGHGTHIAGIVASQDSTYTGFGYGIDYLINVKAGWHPGYMLNSDMMQGVEWAIINGADVISYSYGSSYASASDCSPCRFFDAVVDDLGITVAISAGNDGPGSPSVGRPAIAYNVFSVAALDDKDNCVSSDDEIASYSSRGPTFDGRVKPDITAPGHDIRSTHAKWEGIPLWPSADGCVWGPLVGGWNFVDNCGTSMAAPAIAGSVPLVLDYKGYRWNPKAVRALFFNTARSEGIYSFRDTYGWGVIDLNHAYFHKDDVFLDSVQEGKYKFYKGLNVYDNDKVTLVWNRHVTYNNDNYPTDYDNINDLDLRLYERTTGDQIDYSVSAYDNVERVASDGSYAEVILKVEAYSSNFSHNSNYEEFALATEEGFSPLNGPEIIINQIAPMEYQFENLPFTVNLTVTNNGDMNLGNIYSNLQLPSGLFIVSGDNPTYIGLLEEGESMMLTWQVSSDQNGTYHGLSSTYLGSLYGETMSGQSNTNSIAIAGSGSDPPDCDPSNNPEDVSPTSTFVDFYSLNTSFNGSPVSDCSKIIARDPDGVVSGSFTVGVDGEYGMMHVYGDDTGTGEDEGAVSGDTIKFFIDGYEAHVLSGDPTWTTHGALKNLDLSVTFEEPITISLNQAWNLISIPMLLQNKSIEHVLSSLGDPATVGSPSWNGTYLRVLSFDQGGKTFDPTLPVRFSDLREIDEEHGYWIYMRKPDNLTVSGLPVVNRSIRLNSGWNLVSYLDSENKTPEQALWSLGDPAHVGSSSWDGNYSRVLSFDQGAKTFDPTLPVRFSDLRLMEMFFGYWIYMVEPDTLVYS